MKTPTNKILLLIVLVVSYINIEAQTNKLECQKKLDEAKSLYGQGLFIDTELLLKETTHNCKFDWISKQDAWELLLKVLLELDKIHEADSVRYLILKQDPNYELKENGNPEEFNRFMKQVKVHPLFSIGARNSFLHASLPITQTYFILEDVNYNVPYTTTSASNTSNSWFLRYYGWLEFEFKKDISVNLEFSAFTLNYTRTLQKNQDWRLSYSEKMKFIEVPIYFKKYVHATKNIIPYIAGGFGAQYLLSAKATALIDYQTHNGVDGAVVQHPDNIYGIDVKAMRNSLAYEWIAGTGIGYRFKNLSVYFDFRYYGGINSLTKPSNRFQNSTPLITRFYYIDNSVKLNKYELGLSFSYTLKSKIQTK